MTYSRELMTLLLSKFREGARRSARIPNVFASVSTLAYLYLRAGFTWCHICEQARKKLLKCVELPLVSRLDRLFQAVRECFNLLATARLLCSLRHPGDRAAPLAKQAASRYTQEATLKGHLAARAEEASLEGSVFRFSRHRKMGKR